MQSPSCEEQKTNPPPVGTMGESRHVKQVFHVDDLVLSELPQWWTPGRLKAKGIPTETGRPKIRRWARVEEKATVLTTHHPPRNKAW